MRWWWMVHCVFKFFETQPERCACDGRFQSQPITAMRRLETMPVRIGHHWSFWFLDGIRLKHKNSLVKTRPLWWWLTKGKRQMNVLSVKTSLYNSAACRRGKSQCLTTENVTTAMSPLSLLQPNKPTNPAILKPISNKFQQQNSKVVFNVTTTPQILKAVYIRTSYLRTLIANLFPRV